MGAWGQREHSHMAIMEENTGSFTFQPSEETDQMSSDSIPRTSGTQETGA